MAISPQHFDSFYFSSGSYGTYEKDVRSWVSVVARKIARLLKGEEHPKVLDAGCAQGFLLEELFSHHGFSVFGIEYSPYALKTAIPSVKKFITEGSILEARLFPRNSFDAVVCFDVVEYLTEVETHRAIAHLVAWSKRYILFANPYRHSFQASQKKNPDPYRISALSQREYGQIFRKYGAALIEKHNLDSGSDILFFKKR